MQVHLVDGTYELFRHYYARPEHLDPGGIDVGAVRGVISSVIDLLDDGATHVGVATDHVIESFRNDLWPEYKTGAGIDPVLFAQFPLLEDALRALGVAVWPEIELEADDALASAAFTAALDERVDLVVICTPDKDLAQCVRDPLIVQLDRRAGKRFDERAVREKFGVMPGSIPDWLALVGDSADGFPGLPGWGAKSAATVLARYGTIEAIPVGPWDVDVRGAAKLSATLEAGRELAGLFKVLATLRTDGAVGTVDGWEWRGPTTDFAAWCDRLGSARLAQRAEALHRSRAGSGGR